MEIFRPLIGFVLGLAVMAGAYVGGLLDRIPHRSRDFTHWSGGSGNGEADQARYRISASFQPPGGNGEDDASCRPQFEFHNHTNRTVAFSADGDDDPGYGPQQPGQDYVSTTPDEAVDGPGGGSSRNGRSHDDGRRGYGQQGYGQHGGDSRDYDGQDYDGQDTGSGQYDESNAQYDPYDDEYPGPSGGGCSAGVIDVYLDRSK